jgi:hypothetical protein
VTDAGITGNEGASREGKRSSAGKPESENLASAAETASPKAAGLTEALGGLISEVTFEDTEPIATAAATGAEEEEARAGAG